MQIKLMKAPDAEMKRLSLLFRISCSLQIQLNKQHNRISLVKKIELILTNSNFQIYKNNNICQLQQLNKLYDMLRKINQ